MKASIKCLMYWNTYSLMRSRRGSPHIDHIIQAEDKPSDVNKDIRKMNSDGVCYTVNK